MEAVDKLLEWAETEGVKLNGIKPSLIPGRGIGIVAQRDIKENEVVITVPHKLLRTYDSTPKHIVTALKGCTVHGILAASVCLETDPSFAIWKATWPTVEDFDIDIPMRWPLELRDLVPHYAKALLVKQQGKFERDWRLCRDAFPHDFTKDQYMYAWLIVNTRSFYHTTPKTERFHKHDHMALQPVSDLFNHASVGCHVKYDADGFTILANKDHKAGQELYIRYGHHSNDFLLIEYGFVVPCHENPFDDTCIDVYMCPRFTVAQSEIMAANKYWGNFMVDNNAPCYRSQVAARVLGLPEEDWPGVFAGTRDDGPDSEETKRQLAFVLRLYEKDIRRIMNEIARSYDGEEESRELLRRRWLEVKEMIQTTIARLEDDDD
ncbi:hypothetical protein S7711_05884 [Stachybotrys chartarum IBT 7711]|uniref:SET domain-containing protein n=1 Tax=Stachybotrys chartarum (strain CBS 109288 / IBT 7711) TaxID=1280523 RepID=A0A084AKQ3_STACB|nr:hypothetical protein S7711_05884 [Stachybotrys chartarum IBT 7711]KFA51531.1 hypothetical protein S40293_06350 [Stachybotrys chartarum IBT 40293]KFA75355.1 hypothetical protein S40288_01975 [Stachybotrys chartarum IBT 40288]